MPSIRRLAASLEVNANTVAAAFRILRDRGLVRTDGRRGTRVLPRPAVLPARTAAATVVPPGVRELSNGEPDPRLLPRLTEAARRGAATAAGRGYGDDGISRSFAAAARDRLARDGVPDVHLAVTHSTLDAVERVFQADLRPGDRVAVEDPSWSSLLDLLAALGLEPVPLPLDDEGLLPAALGDVLGRVRALVVTSRAQVPTGAAVSRPRAARLRRVLARRRDVVLVEDDHCAALAGVEAAPLAGATDRWAYVRSVSKSWGPDLRVAAVAGDATTIARIRGQQFDTGWVSYLSQETVVALWNDDRAVERVRRAAREYADRREALSAALADRGVRSAGRTGINVWVPVPDEATAVASLLASGWAVAPGARFRPASEPGLRITVATLASSEIEPLAAAVAWAADPPPSRGI